MDPTAESKTVSPEISVELHNTDLGSACGEFNENFAGLIFGL